MSSPIPWYRLALRRLLQLDRPVEPATDEEVNAAAERNYRWNFTVNLLDGASFWFGLSFVSASTIGPLFISKLTDSPLPIGMLAVLGQGGWFLPQLFTASAVERLSRKKPVVVNLGFFLERLPIWLLIPAALLAPRSADLALGLFLLGFGMHVVGAGVVATAWQDLIARCFPVEKRGRFMGLTTFIGTGMGAIGAGLSAWLLATFPFPLNFAYTFLIAAVGITASWVFLALTREPAQPPRGERQSRRQFWDTLRRIMARDHNFRRFLAARIFLALGAMGQGFITVAAVRRWDVADSVVGGFTAALLVGQTAGTLIFGMLADRFGHKLSLELSGMATLLLFALAWLAPSPAWYYVVFFLLGLYLGTIIVSGILVVLEFSAPERRPTYVGLANTSVGVAGALAPLLAIGIAGISYNLLFAVSAAISFFSVILMRWWVQEPRYV